MNFYIGDPHFGHRNIIKYDHRPFNTVTEMDSTLINNWNSVVGVDDTVYILGDVSWYDDPHRNNEILNTLNGRKILIRGNHDKPMKDVKYDFEKVVDYLEISDNGQKVILFHYPILFWNGQFHDSIHLYAHVHNSHQWNIMESTMDECRQLQALQMQAYNVGCMLPWMNYTPRTLNEIIRNYNATASSGR